MSHLFLPSRRFFSVFYEYALAMPVLVQLLQTARIRALLPLSPTRHVSQHRQRLSSPLRRVFEPRTCGRARSLHDKSAREVNAGILIASPTKSGKWTVPTSMRKSCSMRLSIYSIVDYSIPLLPTSPGERKRYSQFPVSVFNAGSRSQTIASRMEELNLRRD